MLQTIKKNISVIPAVPVHVAEGGRETKLLRVAAYCRVSTLQEQQESSYEAQVILDHCLKIQTFFGTGGTFPIIGVYASQFPAGVVLYLFPIVVYLCFITAFLLFL